KNGYACVADLQFQDFLQGTSLHCEHRFPGWRDRATAKAIPPLPFRYLVEIGKCAVCPRAKINFVEFLCHLHGKIQHHCKWNGGFAGALERAGINCVYWQARQSLSDLLRLLFANCIQVDVALSSCNDTARQKIVRSMSHEQESRHQIGAAAFVSAPLAIGSSLYPPLSSADI